MSGNDKQWRDARFKKALEMAPDAAERPSDAVRETILQKARATAAETAAASAPKPKAKRSGWSLGVPWNSALATVAVVGLVSVLWWREDLPKQAQEAAPTPAAVPAVSIAESASAPAAEASADKKIDAETMTRLQADEKLRLSAAASERAKPEPGTLPRAQKGEVPVPVVITPPVLLKPVPVVIPPESYPAPAPVAPPPPPVLAPPPAKSTLAQQAAPAFAAAPPPAPAPVPPPPAPAPSPVAAPAPLAARAVEPKFENVIVTGRRAEAVTAWTALRVQTPSGPVVLPNDALPASGQVLLQQQLRELREHREQAADTASSTPALARARRSSDLEVDVMYEDDVVAHLTLDAGELRQQIEAALADARTKPADKPADKASDKAR